MRISNLERERKKYLICLWHQRPEGKRTEADLVEFYREMERTFPHLLRRHLGDPYWSLSRDLVGHIEERRGKENEYVASVQKERTKPTKIEL